MDFYNTDYYDRASDNYSSARYPDKVLSYIQYVFKKRLSYVLKHVGKIIKHNNKKNLRLLESGCADGIVINEINKKYGNYFINYVGTDISPGMINAANKINKNNKAEYYLKNTTESGTFDILIAVGFISRGILDDEFNYLDKFMNDDGIIICSFSGKDSIYKKIKLKDKEYVKDYVSYKDYENYLRQKYEIIDSSVYGLFIPKIWHFPYLARYIQNIAERLFFMFPSLFQERLYIIKKKG